MRFLMNMVTTLFIHSESVIRRTQMSPDRVPRMGQACIYVRVC